MIIYNYDPVTKVFTYPEEADEDPKERGKFLIPANATSLPPPTVKPGEVAAFNDGVWLAIPAKVTPEQHPTFDNRYAMVKGGKVIAVLESKGQMFWGVMPDVFMIVDTACLARVGGTFDGVKFALDAD